MRYFATRAICELRGAMLIAIDKVIRLRYDYRLRGELRDIAQRLFFAFARCCCHYVAGALAPLTLFRYAAMPLPLLIAIDTSWPCLSRVIIAYCCFFASAFTRFQELRACRFTSLPMRRTRAMFA